VREQEDTRTSKGRGIKTPTDCDRFVAGCREEMLRQMRGLIDDLFSKLDEALYDLADKTEGEQAYAICFDAMRIFRRRRADILSLFLRNLNAAGAAEDLPLPSIGRRLSARGALQGLEESTFTELEESLALTNLISKAENRYRGELFSLRRHQAALARKESVDSRSDPLGPHHICTAFRGALSLVQGVDLPIKLIVYKLFDKQVMDRLGRVYARCCRLASGLEQEVQSSTTPGPPFAAGEPGGGAATREQTPAPATAFEVAVPGQGQTTGSERASVFQGFQRLLRRKKRLGGEGDMSDVIAPQHLARTLSQLARFGPHDAAPAVLRERLRQDLRLGEGKGARRLDPMDADTLDLVFLLFGQLLQGADIPQPLKQLIARLQVPTLKVALRDKSFFEDRQHPARRLLNHLAQVAIGWNDDGDRSQTSLYAQLDRVIDRLVSDDSADHALFAHLDAELCELLIREQEASHSQEARAQQDLDLRERRHSAQRLVEETIARSVSDRGPVPAAIGSLVFEGWRAVMLQACLESGTDGIRWREAVATLERLLWSMQPKTSAAERRELLRTIPELVRTLRDDLTAVSYDQRQLAKSLRELQALHVTALRGTGLEPHTRPVRNRFGGRQRLLGWRRASDGAADSPLSRPFEEPARGSEGKDGPDGDRIFQLAELAAGTWMEIRGENGQLTRVKLAWRSPRAGICLFVDRRGHKVLELAGEDIRRLQGEGTLTVLGNTPIVDRAMRDLANTLQDERDP